MKYREQFKKPPTILYAEWALWAWIAWTCLFGIYQSWSKIPDIEQIMADEFQGLYSIDPSSLTEIIIATYAVVAALSAWVVFRIGAGKNWARGSLLWSFILELFWLLAPPYHEVSTYLINIPDLGLQVYALYILYTDPGSRWFLSEYHQ